MMGIITWLLNIAKGIAFWFGELFREIVKITTQGWATVVLIAGLADLAFEDAVGAINEIISVLSSVSAHGPAHATPVLSYGLQLANTFCPMDELFQYASAYMVLGTGIGIYRLIKSWIPTLSGSG